jgi:hypothetical protein
MQLFVIAGVEMFLSVHLELLLSSRIFGRKIEILVMGLSGAWPEKMKKIGSIK